uniref:O-antigen ligase domain-containing protein n=1 Tax=Desulfatirhabdium butyrativorans TaxID=340467 RepID=A0A7C4RRD6_9BACT
MEKGVFMAAIPIFIALVAAPVLFGAVHTYAYTTVFTLVLIGALITAVSQVRRDPESGKLCYEMPLVAMNGVMVVGILWCLLQMVPLPVAVVNWLQPKSFFYAQMAQSPQDSSRVAVSLAPYLWPVRQSLVRFVVYGMLYWSLIQILSTRKRVETLIWLVLGIAALESLYGLYEAFSGTHRILWYGKSVSSGNVSGTYINRNHFAGLMEMALILAVCAGAAIRVGRLESGVKSRIKSELLRKIFPFISGRHGGEKRVILLVLGAIIGLGLIGSASRGGILSAAAGLFVVALLFLKTEDTRKKGKVMLAVVAIASILAFRVDIEKVLQRFERIDASLEVRNRYAKQTVRLAADFPVTGVGFGNFKHAYPHYQSPEDKDYFIDFAHNDWAQLVAEAGWGGAVAAAGCVAALLAEMWIRWRKRNQSWSLCLGAAGIGAAVAIGFHSYSDFNLHIPANAMILTAVLAVGHSALVLQRMRSGYQLGHRMWKGPLWGKGGVALLLVLGLIAYALNGTLRHAAAEAHCQTVPNSTLRKPAPPTVSDCLKAIGHDAANAAVWFKLGLAVSVLQTADEERLQAAAQPVLSPQWASIDHAAAASIRDRLAEAVRSEDETRRRWRLNQAAIAAWEHAAALNPFDAHTHLTLGWAYCRYPEDPSLQDRWIGYSEERMKRAAYLAPMDLYLQESLGNYWIMRASRIPSHPVAFQVTLNKALHHYARVLSLLPEPQKKRTRDRMIQTATRYGLKFEDLLKIGKL